MTHIQLQNITVTLAGEGCEIKALDDMTRAVRSGEVMGVTSARL